MRSMLIGLALLAGCDAGVAREPTQREQVRAPGRPDVVGVSGEDPEMNAAKLKARAELPRFFALLAAPPAGTADYSVKYNLTPQGDDPEFIWAGDLKREGGKLVGRLGNQPIAPGFSLGQRVVIPEADIIDWGYTKNGVMQGHHTTRALLAHLSPEEAAQVKQSLGW